MQLIARTERNAHTKYIFRLFGNRLLRIESWSVADQRTCGERMHIGERIAARGFGLGVGSSSLWLKIETTTWHCSAYRSTPCPSLLCFGETCGLVRT